MTKSFLTTIVACALLLAPSFAQDPEYLKKLDPQKHRELMPVHVRMLEDMKKQEAELAALLAAMNSATGERRIDAIIAAVNKMAEQRKAMNEKMVSHLDR